MTPRATYRLQFNGDFGFAQAEKIARYLARLGVSHIYASPWLKVRPGSSHGYDVVDHHALNSELGDHAALDGMVAALRGHGLRQILDFVPNHMGVGGSDNPLWLDVLEWGRNSAHAGWFDIDWEPDAPYLRNKVLVPLLGNQYGVELHSGRLALKFDDQEGSFAVWAYDKHKLPITPLCYAQILGNRHPELERLGDAFVHLPDWRPQVARRADELKAELARSAREHEDLRAAVDTALRRFTGNPGDDESWKNLDALIRNQNWRAAHFRVAADDINYRRFFDINELAGLRMELPDVFDHAHSLIFSLLENSTLDGLRIDHVDGLLNPKEYLQRLRGLKSPRGPDDPFYLVVEKILAQHEALRDDWPVDGTTGYEFTNLVLGLLVDPAGEEPLTRHYTEFTGDTETFAETVHRCKLRIMRTEMGSELNALAREVARVARSNPVTEDFTHGVLQRAIREVVACFPVYRTYVDSEDQPTEDDRRDLNWATKQARVNETSVDESVFDFVGNVLSGDLVAEGGSGFSRSAVLRCAMKLQQYSGPVMAKGLEDTAFYRYNRFIALNEVGGYPDRFGVTLSSFHKANAYRAKHWPNSLLATSTHDTKRGEDTRARLAVLSEIPDEWIRQTTLWSRILRARRGDIDGSGPPDPNDEYLFYQLLTGTWPVELIAPDPPEAASLQPYLARIEATMTKSIREAKVHSNWAAPDPNYENAVLTFVEGALDPGNSRVFFAAFLPFVARVAQLSVQNSLVQTTLKLTVPGVPDIYQGSELWDLSMVDPDNRRPVDYASRVRLMDEMGNRTVRELVQNWQDGAVKLYVITKILALRAEEPLLFAKGEYDAMSAVGPQSDSVCGFARRLDERAAVVLTARFPARLEGSAGWRGTTIALPSALEGADFTDILTGAEVSGNDGSLDASAVLADLPVAVLRAH